MPKARGGGREDQPHIQGAMAVRAQEGLEKEMAIHSSILVWKIPGTESLEGYRPWGRRVGHNFETKQ